VGSFGVVAGISIASAYEGVSLTNLRGAISAYEGVSLTNLGEEAAASDESLTNLGEAGAATVWAPRTAPTLASSTSVIGSSGDIASGVCSVHVCLALVDAASALMTSDGLG
jgi:hypothetical protein